MPIPFRPLPLRSPVPPAVLALVLACSAVELALQAADHGLIGTSHWRSLCYQYAGFWPGLLFDWQPNYRAQPVVMFFSYGFLHAGLGHLGGNMLTLLLFGHVLQPDLGNRAIGLVLGVSSLGGALVFGLLSQNPAPMVGASGAIFGLIGAWMVLHRAERQARALPPRSLALLAGFLVLNLVFWWASDGWLAWQAHLGGFLAGAGLTLYLRPIRAKIRS
jgi:rhomboid protease GluP